MKMTGIFYTAQHLICNLRNYCIVSSAYIDDDHKSQLYFSYSRDIIFYRIFGTSNTFYNNYSKLQIVFSHKRAIDIGITIF